jgi:hypothetical protein
VPDPATNRDRRGWAPSTIGTVVTRRREGRKLVALQKIITAALISETASAHHAFAGIDQPRYSVLNDGKCAIPLVGCGSDHRLANENTVKCRALYRLTSGGIIGLVIPGVTIVQRHRVWSHDSSIVLVHQTRQRDVSSTPSDYDGGWSPGAISRPAIIPACPTV